MSTSVVMNILSGEFVTIPLFSTGESGTGIIDYKEILTNLNVPSALTPVLTFLLSNTISLVWNCGVQTILFLAGLQSIPDSLYEVSKIEGANRWEEFWWITVPSLRNIISLVMIYTMIDLFSDMKNEVVSSAGIRRKLCKALVLFSYSYHCNRHRLRFISAFMRKTLGIKELIYFYWVYPGKEHVYENKTYFKYSLKLNAVSRYINAVYFRFGRYAERPAGE